MDRVLDDIPQSVWAEACRREAVIRPLVEAGRRISASQLEAAMRDLGLCRSAVYQCIAAYRAHPVTSTLLRGKGGRPKGSRKISADREAIIQSVIERCYLSKQRPRLAHVMREIRAACHGEHVPDIRSVKRRIANIDPRTEMTARKGARKARERYGVTLPRPQPIEPLSLVEIDHTPVDVIVVDEGSRKPIGRPWLTLAIDVATRMVAGFLLSFDHPSALSVALVLAHAVLPKEPWLAERQLEYAWPVHGLPDRIRVDNGEEFHSDALRRGAQEYGIEITYRTPGSPQQGGHIERLIGTFMQRVHVLPGTTFSNVGEKGNYDSERHSALSLTELERWLATEVLGVYHTSVHSALGKPPLAMWEEQLGRRTQKIREASDAHRLLIDFLPGVKRLVRRDGLRIFGICYWDSVLSPYAGRSKEPYLVKYDPRNLARVFLRDDSGTYWPIPYRNLGAPPISLWEWRATKQKLHSDGLKLVDEKLIFRAIEEECACPLE